MKSCGVITMKVRVRVRVRVQVRVRVRVRVRVDPNLRRHHDEAAAVDQRDQALEDPGVPWLGLGLGLGVRG